MQKKLAIELNWDYTSMSKQDMENATREILYKKKYEKIIYFLGISLSGNIDLLLNTLGKS